MTLEEVMSRAYLLADERNEISHDCHKFAMIAKSLESTERAMWNVSDTMLDRPETKYSDVVVGKHVWQEAVIDLALEVAVMLQIAGITEDDVERKLKYQQTYQKHGAAFGSHESYHCNNTECKAYSQCRWAGNIGGEDIKNPKISIDKCVMYTSTI